MFHDLIIKSSYDEQSISVCVYQPMVLYLLTMNKKYFIILYMSICHFWQIYTPVLYTTFEWARAATRTAKISTLFCELIFPIFIVYLNAAVSLTWKY